MSCGSLKKLASRIDKKPPNSSEKRQNKIERLIDKKPSNSTEK